MALPKPKRDYGRIIENVAVVVGLTVLVVLALNWLTGCQSPFIKASLIDLPPATATQISSLPNPSTIMAQAEVPWWMWILGWATGIAMSMFGSHKVRKMDHRRQEKHKKGPYGKCDD